MKLMDNYLLTSPYSLFASFLLLLGNFSLGHFFLKIKIINKIINQISNVNFQKILIGQIILIFFIFISIIFIGNAKTIFSFFLYLNFFLLICFFFEIFFFNSYILNISFKKKNSLYFYILLLVLILYFFLASSPITDADSLDYHFGSAINLLKYNEYILPKEWLTLAQSGAGEVLIGLGLFLGAEQYSSLIQFSGMFSICGVLLRVSEKNKIFKSSYFLPLIVLTSPVLLFLGNTAKPQLFFSACLLISLSIIFRDEWKKNIIISYVIINVLIFICIIGKFSFNLSGFLIWLLATIRIINIKNTLKLLLITTVSFFIIYLPYIYWKWSQYGGNFFLYFLSPFPLHLPGYNFFFSHVKSPSEFKFPYFLFTTNSLSTISETLGFSSLIFLYFIFCKKNIEIYMIIFICILYLIGANLYASPNARYFLDILLWLAFGLKYVKNYKYLKFLNFLYLMQIFIIIFCLLYSVYNFFPGSFTQQKYLFVKNKYANEYAGIKWVEKELLNEKVVIFSRSTSVYSGTSISGSFINFTTPEQSLYYKNLIKEKEVKYYATFGKSPRLEYFEGCIKGLYRFKNDVGNSAVRNPFAKKTSYNGYIYHLDYSKLPNCN
jgi:hypothetical protein